MADRAELRPLAIASDSLRVEVMEFGASLVGVWTPDRDGRAANVVCHLAEQASYAHRERNPHLGAMVGRYANRIAGARIEVDDVQYALVANDGSNTLHGGATGWSRRAWTTVGHDASSVDLELVDPDGEQGFPGEVRVRVRYAVDGASLHITASASTDRATVVSMTNHAYWNLAGAGRIDDHELWIDSGRFAEVDDEMIPTGAFTAIDDGVVPIVAASGAEPGRWDNWFELRAGHDVAQPAARMVHHGSGRTMTMWTDQPGLQVYTGDNMAGELGPRRGLCVEAGHRPDSADECVLRPDTLSHWSVRHLFGLA